MSRVGDANRRVGDAIVSRTPVAAGGYDVVVGDLLSTQILFAALLDAEVRDVHGNVARTKDAVTSERRWTWPFAADTTYLVRGTVACVRH